MFLRYQIKDESSRVLEKFYQICYFLRQQPLEGAGQARGIKLLLIFEKWVILLFFLDIFILELFDSFPDFLFKMSLLYWVTWWRNLFLLYFIKSSHFYQAININTNIKLPWVCSEIDHTLGQNFVITKNLSHKPVA